MSDRTCSAIVEPFVRALEPHLDLPALQIIGGNGSAALLDPDTVIDLRARTIEAPARCDLSPIRDDGSLRDLDVLVLSTDADRVEAARAVAEDTVGTDLEVSIFGLKTIDDLDRQRRRPLRTTARVFLGDRYVAARSVAALAEGADDGTGFDGFKALYPFRVPIPAASLETYRLTIGGRPPVPTSHPGATILNYLTRSISGLRAKDAAKVTAMVDNVVTRHPEVGEWIESGPGRSSFELARVLHTLREPRRSPRPLLLGAGLVLDPHRLDGLVDHPAFLSTGRGRVADRAVVAAAHRKARLVARVESNQTVVGFWHRHVEQRIGTVIHNRL